MGNSNMFKERNPQACLTKGSYAGCDTRWRGLESHLIDEIPEGRGHSGTEWLPTTKQPCSREE